MKVTIVSTLPFPLREPKYGLIPDLYEIKKAKRGEFSTLRIKDGYHYQLIPLADIRMPPLKVVDLGETIAESIINDYASGCLGVDYTPLDNGAIPKPGLFWLEDWVDDLKIKIQHKDKLEQANLNTMAWFERLVKIADDDWSKYHQYRFITDNQRDACNWLGLQREWNFSVFEANNSLCWACKKVVNPTAVICSCNAILNMEEYEKNKSKFIVTK